MSKKKNKVKQQPKQSKKHSDSIDIDKRSFFSPALIEAGIVVAVVLVIMLIAVPAVLAAREGAARNSDWSAASDLRNEIMLSSYGVGSSGIGSLDDYMNQFFGGGLLFDPFAFDEMFNAMMNPGSTFDVIIVGRNASALPQGITGNLTVNGQSVDNIYVQVQSQKFSLDEFFSNHPVQSQSGGGADGWDWYAVVGDRSTGQCRIISGYASDKIEDVLSSDIGSTNIEKLFDESARGEKTNTSASQNSNANSTRQRNSGGIAA